MRPTFVASLLVVSCAAPDDARPRTLTLEPCRLAGLDRAAECGVLTVPEDPEAPAGRKIDLRVVVVPPREEPATGALYMLAGGPGQAASEAWPQLLPALDEVTRAREIVLVDQRGTGASRPLDCEPKHTDDLASKLEMTPPRAELEACLAGLEAEPKLYTTVQAADDLDAVRAALGHDAIDLLGGSYGTRAALVYARQHPDHVRRIVIDGVAPVDIALPLSFARDGQAAFDALVADCAVDPACSAAFPDLAGDLRAVLDDLGPAGRDIDVTHPRTGARERVRLSADVVAGGVRGTLYAPMLAALLPLGLQRARAGDFDPLLAQMLVLGEQLEDSFSVGMFLSVVCAEDVPWIEDAAADAETRDTFLGRSVLDRMREACLVWPRAEIPAAYREPVRTEAPVLLLSGALDPVTPPRWAEHAMVDLPDARHVIVPGTGHGTLGVACVGDLVADFLDGIEPDGSCVATVRRPPFFVDFAGPPA